MVPEMHAKAAEGENSGWIQVTEDNKQEAIDSLPDWLGDDKFSEFSQKVASVHGKYFVLSDNTMNLYLCQKTERQGVYVYLYKNMNGKIKYGSVEGVYGPAATTYYYPQYTVTFDTAGGSMSEGNTATTVVGLLMDLPTPTREGYLFAGWFDGYESTESVYADTVYDKDTTLQARWCKKWTEGSEECFEATDIEDVKSLPRFNSLVTDNIDTYLETYNFPEDAEHIYYGRYDENGITCYMYYDAKKHHRTVFFNASDEDLAREFEHYKCYILKDTGEVPATPTPEPTTPTPAPATPTPAPSAGNSSSSSSSDSGSSAQEPVLTTTNVAGEQITGWDAITKVIATLTKDKQQNVSGANQDLLHVDASGFDKTIPAATVKAVSTSALRGLHVFIGNSDAVTFLAKSNLADYKETNFEHKDTVTDHSRPIDFTNKQVLGTTVVFHTTVPVKNGEVTVYKVDANGRTSIFKTISNANGQICFPITETATYVLEY